ncbi:UDP-N-acetylmuramate--L-alanine ligase [Patescibacteria group bacterium]|nr:UDP-N-acetylmuramate--L-alanine ligase [Patescibacteria group bacterium]
MKVHFLGIGGIGVSALAQYYLADGQEVSGCDLAPSELTTALSRKGAVVRTGEPEPSCVPEDTDLLIYSPAISAEHPERVTAREKGILEFSYPEALGDLTRTHYTIAVSGTHGKSTTTAMIALVLLHGGLDPTVIVGTKLKEFGNSNFRIGKNGCLKNGKPFLVIEADEHTASFLHYWPDVIVLTSLEADHMDYYKTLENLQETFKEYLTHLPVEGQLVANGDDTGVKSVLPQGRTTHLYALESPEAKEIRNILQVPGEHNVSNALAAFHVGRLLGIEKERILEALSSFKGSWRRFEVFELAEPVSYTLVSDYGHHPTEVKVTVEAARAKWPNRPLWLVFQPHQYHRTFTFFEQFVKVLSGLPANRILLTPIYGVPGREDASVKERVSSEKLAKAVSKAQYVPTLSGAQELLQKELTGGEVVIVMGAGDIYELTLRLCSG